MEKKKKRPFWLSLLRYLVWTVFLVGVAWTYIIEQLGRLAEHDLSYLAPYGRNAMLYVFMPICLVYLVIVISRGVYTMRRAGGDSRRVSAGE